MRIIEVSGPPRALGEGFGEACRDEIRAFYAARLSNALEQARTYGGRAVNESRLLEIGRRCLPLVESFHPDGFLELTGIARGAGLSPEAVWAMNALTDLRDYAAYGPDPLPVPAPVDGEGCSSIVVPASRGASGSVLAAQTWDLSTDNMPFVCVVRRRPSVGPSTLALTTTGCLSLIGMNAHGVAVGTTNLRTTDVRLGVGYLDVIHAALTAPNLESACQTVRRAIRMGAHYFYLADRERGEAFEGSARRLIGRRIETEVFIHTNHALTPEVGELEAEGTPMASSHYRHTRLQALARQHSKVGIEDLRRFLADAQGGELAINRRDFGGISTNGAVIMDPKALRLDVVHGPPADGVWQTMSL